MLRNVSITSIHNIVNQQQKGRRNIRLNNNNNCIHIPIIRTVYIIASTETASSSTTTSTNHHNNISTQQLPTTNTWFFQPSTTRSLYTISNKISSDINRRTKSYYDTSKHNNKINTIINSSSSSSSSSSSYNTSNNNDTNRSIMRFSTSSSSSRASSSSALLKAPFLLLTTACVLSFNHNYYTTPQFCYAENAPWLSRLFSNRKSSSTSTSTSVTDESSNAASSTNTEKNGSGGTSRSNCPYYGCLIRPIDVHYMTDHIIKNAIEQLRIKKRIELMNSDAEKILYESLHITNNSNGVTLTLIGYKGGSMQEQINQDRSIVISPYYIVNNNNTTRTTKNNNEFDINEKKKVNDETNFLYNTDRILLGVFDGHAALGELVSEYTATTLPSLLAQKLVSAHKNLTTNTRSNNAKNDTSATTTTKITNDDDDNTVIHLTKQALEETFVELDKTAPAEKSGGCTASIVLQQGNYIYVANAGDSRSFIVSYRPSTNASMIIGISREDKPNLPDERERVEAMGGQVYIPIRGTSRVVYYDPTSGAPTGLAMSRSIGDWEAGKLGVIPNPLIQVYNIQDIVRTTLQNSTTTAGTTEPFKDDAISPLDTAQIDASGGVTFNSNSNTTGPPIGDPTLDDVYIFAVCATDGMMDYMNETDIAHILGHSFYADDGAHPVAAVEHLVYTAANLWHHAKSGRYRDDIAISVSTLRKPPQSSSSSSSESARSSSSTTIEK